MNQVLFITLLLLLPTISGFSREDSLSTSYIIITRMGASDKPFSPLFIYSQEGELHVEDYRLYCNGKPTKEHVVLSYQTKDDTASTNITAEGQVLYNYEVSQATYNKLYSYIDSSINHRQKQLVNPRSFHLYRMILVKECTTGKSKEYLTATDNESKNYFTELNKLVDDTTLYQAIKTIITDSIY